jgi:hexosaminidase
LIKKRSKFLNFHIDIEATPEELREGIQQLAFEYPISFDKSVDSRKIRFLKSKQASFSGSLRVNFSWEILEIEYLRKSDAFRALSLIMSQEITRSDGLIEEKNSFENLGFMLDCSRNAVMSVDCVKRFLRRLALMGYNVFMLYTEDTYEMPDYPFFGYLRGAYTAEEFKELDDYAYNLGIEIIPCIQTLGHLEQILQWDAFSEVKDTPYTLLPGEEKTYKLIEDMIDAATAPLRSKRIHIGMDEARMLGSGVYKTRFSEKSAAELTVEHLEYVYSMCKKRGLKPIIWNDCIFRNGTTYEGYYDSDAPIPEHLLSKIPEDVQMVHWDYWHNKESDYADYIDYHRKCGREPIIAPCAVATARFWCAIEHAFRSVVPCVKACKQKNIKEMLITTWGDDGSEVDFMSTLPVAQLLAEYAYNDIFEQDKLDNNFRAVNNAEFKDYRKACHIDLFPSQQNAEYQNANCAKWLLWDDPLLGLCEPYHEDELVSEHYRTLAEDLESVAESGGYANSRLRFPAQIARTLFHKADLRKKIVNAYQAKNKEKLSGLLKNDVRKLIENTERLWMIHRDMWFATNKPFGWEVIEGRYGRLIARLKTLKKRLEMYLDGECCSLPEFETKLYKFISKPSRSFMSPLLIKSYNLLTTPSAQK